MRRTPDDLSAEALAIVAFAVSWLVKGEAHEAMVRATRNLARKAKEAR